MTGTRMTTARRAVAAIALTLVAPLVTLGAGSGAGAATVVATFPGVGYGYLATGANGSVWASNYESSTLTQISASGGQTTVSVDRAWGLTSDPQGNAYVDDYSAGGIYIVTPAESVSTFATGWSGAYGMAYGPDGDLYVSYADGTIYRIAPGGSYTTFATNAGGLGLAFDHSGNLYSSAGSTIYEISRGGSVSTFATVSGASFYGLAVAPYSNVLVAADDSNGVVDEFSPSGSPTVVVSYTQLPGAYTEVGSVAFDSAGNLYVGEWESENVYKVSGVAAGGPPTNLAVTPGTQSLTATWSSAASGETFVCTLMFGYGDPSSFTQVVSSPSCTFSGLDPSTTYGISVAESFGSTAIGPSAIAFGQPIAPPSTITCVRKHKTRHITGVSPTCPAGWHRAH